MITSLQVGLRWSSKVSGGADRVFSDLAGSLPEAGIGFMGVVAGADDLSIHTGGRIHSFAPEHVGTLTRLRGARRKIGDLLNRERPSLLASHFALYAFPLLDRLSERPFVMHFHGPWGLESRAEGASALLTAAQSFIESRVYERADRIIVLSAAFADLLQHQYGADGDKVRIVPGAVDLHRFAPTMARSVARAMLGWPCDRPIILSVRRLVHRMGLNQLLEALDEIRKAVPDVLYVVAGTGPLRTELEAKVDALSLQHHVQFAGFLSDELLPVAYRAADLSVVPTITLEGFGLVAAESLAAGTPVMVTPVGGLPEVVAGLSKDLVFVDCGAREIAQGLRRALSGQMKLPDQEQCCAYAEANFSRNLMASRVAAVYAEVAS